MTTANRFTFHRSKESNLVVFVREAGEPIGQLSRTRGGYELRNNAGKPVDEVFGVSRPVAAGILAQIAKAEVEQVA